ncbi:MAG TPA: diguanylate cyclase, partial [Humisphaera sp.]
MPRGEPAGSLPTWLRGTVPEADRDDVLTALNDGTILAVTDARGRITYTNDRFCEVSGYTRAELLGRDHRVINSGVHPRSFWAAMYRVVSAGGTWRGEVCNRAKDGRLYWVDTVVCGLLGPDGRLRRMVAMRAEITARKLAEQELRHATERLAYDAAHDVLTGLANRARLYEQVARALDRARAEPGFRFAILYLDLDRFKVVNDSLGHAAGDLLLTIIAARLSACADAAAAGAEGVVARL